MKTAAIIGYGAMAKFVHMHLADSSWTLTHCIAREGREVAAKAALGKSISLAYHANDLETLPDLVIDCAGHPGLKAHGAAFLRRGVPLVSTSLGALADEDMHVALKAAAIEGETQLHLASGAIGALDALSAAKIGGLNSVRYRGTKPPQSWRGTPAEDVTPLDGLSEPVTHFEGSAREAALRYPKNANVAAAVALAGLGFDETQTCLIADPNAQGNMHQLTARGAFGSFEFSVWGNSLPETPRTSALAAMSVVDRIFRQASPITF